MQGVDLRFTRSWGYYSWISVEFSVGLQPIFFENASLKKLQGKESLIRISEHDWCPISPHQNVQLYKTILGRRGTNNCETLAEMEDDCLWSASGKTQEDAFSSATALTDPEWLWPLNSSECGLQKRTVSFKKASVTSTVLCLSYNTFLFYTFIQKIFGYQESKKCFFEVSARKIPKYFPLFCN